MSKNMDEQRLMSGHRVSKSAIAIRTPANAAPRQSQPTTSVSNRRKTFSDAPSLGTYEQVSMMGSRRNNVRLVANNNWSGHEDFADERDHKRRKINHASPAKANGAVGKLRQRSEDEPIWQGSKTINRQKEVYDLTGDMPPPAVSPTRLSTRSGGSRGSVVVVKPSASQVSHSAGFGHLQEVQSTYERGDARQARRNGVYGTSPIKKEVAHGLRRPHQPSDASARSATTFRRQIQLDRPEAKVTVKQSMSAAKSQDKDTDDDEDLEIALPTALDDEGQAKLRKETNAGFGTNSYSRARQKERRAVDSGDELAEDDSFHNIARVRKNSFSDDDSNVAWTGSVKQRHFGVDNAVKRNFYTADDSHKSTVSKDDIQTSPFVKSKEPELQLGKKHRAGTTSSGWQLKSIASNLCPLITGGATTLTLQQGRKVYYIVTDTMQRNAIDLNRMRSCTGSGDKIVLAGDDGAWTALQFATVPERSHFFAHIKRQCLKISWDDPGKDRANARFEQVLHDHAMDKPPLSTLSTSTPRSWSDKGFETVGKSKQPDGKMDGAATKKIDTEKTSASKRESLISRMTTTAEPAAPARRPTKETSRQAESLQRNSIRKTRNSSGGLLDVDGDLVSGARHNLLRRSGRETKAKSRFFDTIEDDESGLTLPNVERYSKKFGLGDPWEFSLTYPLNGKDRATVEFHDLERLDDGEFLNDNLIEFYLRWARQQQLDAGTYEESQVHFFNTFFYEKLSAGGRSINYKAVESWTRKVDIFDVDYIVIPVNQSLHWYVCIICNLPNFTRAPDVMDLTGDAEPGQAPTISKDASDRPEAQSTFVTESESTPVRGFPAVNDDSQDLKELKTPSSVLPIETSSDLSLKPDSKASPMQVDVLDDPGSGIGSNGVEPSNPNTQASQDSIHLTRVDGVFKNSSLSTPRSAKGRRRGIGPAPRKYDPDTTIIITLDSLGQMHPKTTSNIKDYIIAEAAAKHGLDIKKDDIKGMSGTRGIPKQQNHCDCGVYLLGYIHKFLLNPREFVSKILRNEMDEERDWPDMDPSKLRANVRDTIQKTYSDQLPERRKMMKGKRKTAEPTVTASTEQSTPPIQPSSPIKSTSEEQDPGNDLPKPLPTVPWPNRSILAEKALSEAADAVSSSAEPALASTDRPSTPVKAANSTSVLLEDAMLLDGSENDELEAVDTVQVDSAMDPASFDKHTVVEIPSSPLQIMTPVKEKSRGTNGIVQIQESPQEKARPSMSLSHSTFQPMDTIKRLESIEFPSPSRRTRKNT